MDIRDEVNKQVIGANRVLQDHIAVLEYRMLGQEEKVAEQSELIEKIKRISNNSLYFADSSDYRTALWQILETVAPEIFDKENTNRFSNTWSKKMTHDWMEEDDDRLKPDEEYWLFCMHHEIEYPEGAPRCMQIRNHFKHMWE